MLQWNQTTSHVWVWQHSCFQTIYWRASSKDWLHSITTVDAHNLYKSAALFAWPGDWVVHG